MKDRWSTRLCRVYGIDLEVHATFLLLVGWSAWQGWSMGGLTGALWWTLALLLMFACVVLHELGHSVTALRYGVQVRRIMLLPIGGMAQFDQIPKEPWREIAITAAGPAVNFALAGILFGMVGMPDLRILNTAHLDLGSLTTLLMFWNLLMGLFNLLPVFPMDGGRLLRAFLAFRFDYQKATQIAVWFAKPLALAGIAFAFFYLPNPWFMAALFAFIFLGGEMEYRQVAAQEQFSGKRVGDLMSRDFTILPNDVRAEDIEALHRTRPTTALVVMEGSRALAVYPSDEMTKAIERARVGANLATGFPPHPLHATWPMEIIGLPKRREVYPVFHFGILVGILDHKPLRLRGPFRWPWRQKRDA